MPITHATAAAPGAISAEEWDADHIGGGGAELLGPFTIAHDTAGIGAGAVITSLSPTTLILDAFFYIYESFDGTDQSLVVRLRAEDNSTVDLKSYFQLETFAANVRTDPNGQVQPDSDAALTTPPFTQQRGVIVVSDSDVLVRLFEAATQGEADVYLLVMSVS